MKNWPYVLLLLPGILAADITVSPDRIRTLYNSLDTQSISQHLAFYELYPQTKEGQLALSQAWRLMTGNNSSSGTDIGPIPDSAVTISSVVDLVNKKPEEELAVLTDEQLILIDKLSERLPNRKLKGHSVKTESEVVSLPTEEIDLARGLFLTQMGHEPDAVQKIRSYEAMLDLMALQILARLTPKASPEQKIRAINDFIFFEQGFRFPPHSLYAKDIDVYTFLPSVLDSRKGVCLGVSILYICLAQRLDLPLEMITPPGHIYVRYRNENKIINIETTARGIDLDSDMYLSVDTRSLQQRTIKEVIGLAHFNQAAVYLQAEDFSKAVASYEKAQLYLPQDMLLKEFLGYNYLFVGRTEEGEKLLREVQYHIPEYAISGETMADDYLNSNIDIEGIKTIFMHVDENRDSIIHKRQELEKTVKLHPQFRAGLFHLAIAWLQLHREAEALDLLSQYHAMVPNDPTAEYYLAIINMERFNYCKAWEHLKSAESIVKTRNHNPKPLKELRRVLASMCPA